MIKKQAESTSEMTPGTLANLALNPWASVLPGSKYFIPEFIENMKAKYRDNPPIPFTGNASFDKNLFHGMATGGTAMALAALARYIMHTSQDKELDKTLRTDSREATVGATNPIFSPDPYLDDLAEEQAQQGIGIDKSAEEAVKEEPKPDTGGVDISPWLKAIVPLSMMIGGGMIGYQGVDKILERNRKSELDTDIDELSNKLDKANYTKLMRARGLDPDELPPPVPPGQEMSADGQVSPIPKQALEDSAKNAIKSMAALVMLSVAASSGVLTKRYFDGEDPQRAEYSEMQQALKELKMREQRKTPISIAPIAPALEQNLNKHLGSPQSAVSHSLPSKIEETPVDMPVSGLNKDKSDRTMALL